LTEINSELKVRLVRLSKPLVWVVYGIADEGWHTVWTDLRAYPRDYPYARFMKVLLSQFVPRNGPPLSNRNQCLPLRDNILEFKDGPKRGQKLRVLWFYDAGTPVIPKRIICTECFTKTSETDQAAIDRAVEHRRRYMAAKASGALEYLGDYDDAKNE
jgi:hypothetical protein